MSIRIARALFFLLIVFEALNTVGILHFHLTFSWFGLILTAMAVWTILELSNLARPHHPAAWPIAITALSVDASSDIFHLYNIPNYATGVHYTLSALFTLLVLLFIWQNAKQLKGWDYFHTWAIVVAFGALYDVEEYWESVFLHNNRYLGAAEMTDITADCFGALTMILIVYLVVRAYERARTIPKTASVSS